MSSPGGTGSELDLASLVPDGLPDGREAVLEGRAMGARVDREPSLFLRHNEVESERAWRERARRDGFHCTCMNIGLSTWADTRDAIGAIYEDALSRGIRPPDRFNLLAERRMGLPKDMRAAAPQETGPALWSDQDWWELANTAPIQPEAADNMIGGPGSVDNVLDALRVGITHVGVLSQYSWRWPYWDDEVTQTMRVLQAGGALSAWRAQGAVFDSYLEDGYPGTFHDYANYVGWAMIERYISEELIGAAYSSSWGGLTQDPPTKAAVSLALHAVNPDGVPAGFVQGDTIGNTSDFDANMAVLSTDVLFMKMVDARYKLGGAPIAVPVTETERIPTWQEVATAHAVSRRLEHYVPIVDPVIDWAPIERQAKVLEAGGRRFFRSAMSALTAGGVDVRDPAQMLLVLKRIGAERAEELFGAGAPDPSFPRGRRPVLETNLVRDTIRSRDALLAGLRTQVPPDALRGRRILVSSTDVHAFAEFLLVSSLESVGARVTDFGINRDPEDIVKAAVETDAEVLVVTTHNGVARSFGSLLRQELEVAGLGHRPIYMGGVLNEDIDGSEVPVDVRQDLREMGILLPDSINDLVQDIARVPASS